MVERVACGGEARPDEAGKDTGATAEVSAEAEGGGQDIAEVLDQVAALRNELDRLIGLVNSAVKKLED